AQLEAAAKKRNLRILRCGDAADADYRLTASSGSGAEIAIGGKTYAVTYNAIGKHWGINAMFALAAVHALGLDAGKSAAKLAEFSEPEGRGRVSKINVDGKAILLIDDSYNASPASMAAAFDKTSAVAERQPGRRIAALGDMLELGPQSAALHEKLAAELARHRFDKVFTSGNYMQHLHEALQPLVRGAHAAKAMELLPSLIKELLPGDILLVKGSHGSKMYELAAALQAYGEKKHAV
ncbi:MAG: UDP-N-acetylmuramoylalanyl-D-glutamyl-2, 6-diaminopimelate--D-alanyl-D-alanine ligase, partial [Pseudomonadota bacterium]|nr:UDP-N-acetylmuramoylalanyl-D-glutamyl-2, 6-diaminopimelate--D-alanyl-D-alanine ligase [Pseudomonadota bacterium]